MTQGPNRLAVRLTPDAMRQVRGGHPWVFDDSVRSVRVAGQDAEGPEQVPAPGDLAVVFDDRRRFAAIGLWDPASPIRIRVLHRGSPRTVDRDLYVEKLRAAAELRAELLADPATTGVRLVHGENDGLPGLVADRYDDTVVLKLYSAAWIAHLDAVLDALVEVRRPRRVVLRLARVVARGLGETPGGDEVGADAAGGPVADGAVLLGTVPGGPVVFSERGLRFEADVVAGQKTGFFLDQRDNRARVRELARGARVLDVFSCTGGFGVAAAAGGARSVHSIDIAPAATAAARRNMDLNPQLRAVRRCSHRTTTGDAHDVMRALARRGERADLVVVDPPSFASRRSQVQGALRAYARLTDAALDLLGPGGRLVQASCSARVGPAELAETVLGVAARRGVRLTEVEHTGHAADHPVGFEHGAYLSAVFARVG